MTRRQLHLLVACPVPLVLEGICLVLSDLYKTTFIQRIHHLDELSTACAGTPPDLIVLQFGEVHLDRAMFLQRLINGHSTIKVVMLVPRHLVAVETEACARYCHAVLPHNVQAIELRKAVAKVLESGRYLPAPRQHEQTPTKGTGLTKRETEVVRWMAKGMRSAEIAARLGTTPNTIQTHRRNILRKLGARTTAELMVSAQQLGIL